MLVMYFDHYWGMHAFWWIFWILLIVALVVWVWPGRRAERDSALDELRRRYAAGEIDDDEYQHRLDVLRKETSEKSAA